MDKDFVSLAKPSRSSDFMSATSSWLTALIVEIRSSLVVGKGGCGLELLLSNIAARSRMVGVHRRLEFGVLLPGVGLGTS